MELNRMERSLHRIRLGSIVDASGALKQTRRSRSTRRSRLGIEEKPKACLRGLRDLRVCPPTCY
jgi:hypothetical protein